VTCGQQLNHQQQQLHQAVGVAEHDKNQNRNEDSACGVSPKIEAVSIEHISPGLSFPALTQV
jgi:hypothetical protein